MRFFEALKFYYSYFGIRQALDLCVYCRIMDHISPNPQRYFNHLLKFQRSICKDVVKYYINKPLVNNELPNDYKIWTCWWQGINQMPEVIRLCYESLLKNANGHEVVLITKDNYKEYLTLPQYIYDKVEQGKISFSHFSDLIRLNLLTQFGGHWMDSALFVVKPLEFAGSIHFQKIRGNDSTLCQGRWSFGDMGGTSTHKIINYMYSCLLDYWSKYDACIDYLMFDGFLRIAYEDIPDIHECIDKFPVYSPTFFWTRYNASKILDDTKWNELLNDNYYLSLTWRQEYSETTLDGSITYYGAMKRLMRIK